MISMRELRTEGRKKTRIPFGSYFILGVYDYFCGVECFPEPVKVVGFSQTRHLKDILELPEAVLNKRHNSLLIPEHNKRVRSQLAAESKRCIRLS